MYIAIAKRECLLAVFCERAIEAVMLYKLQVNDISEVFIVVRKESPQNKKGSAFCWCVFFFFYTAIDMEVAWRCMDKRCRNINERKKKTAHICNILITQSYIKGKNIVMFR